MGITLPTRNELWSKSGNCCAICHCKVVAIGTPFYGNPRVAEEVQIATPDKKSDRYLDLRTKKAYDALDNLVLLCVEHSRLVNHNPMAFTSEVLSLLKRNHEAWVSFNINAGGRISELLQGRDTGKMLVNVQILEGEQKPIRVTVRSEV